MNLGFESLDGCLGLAHFFQDLVVLSLKATHLLLYGLRHLQPLVLLIFQFVFDALEFLLVFLLHQPKGVDQLFNNLECLLDGIVLVVGTRLISLLDALVALKLELLLQLDDSVGQLLDFLLVDVREVLSVRVVELFDGLSEFSVDIDEFFQRFLEGDVLLIEHSVLLPEVINIGREVLIFLPEQR